MKRTVRSNLFFDPVPLPSLSFNFMTESIKPEIGDVNMSFARASDASYIGSDGVRRIAPPNQPRFDYDPVTKALRGLLLEDTRTNYFLNSEAPVSQKITVANGNRYCIWMEGPGQVLVENLTAVLSPVAGYAANGISGTGICTEGQVSGKYVNVFVTTGGDIQLTVTGAGVGTRVQCENGTEPTSYIQTGSTAKQRARDEFSVSQGSWLNTREGTLVAEAESALSTRSNREAVLTELGNSSSPDSNRLNIVQGPGYHDCRMNSAGVSQVTNNTSSVPGWGPNTIRKLLITYRVGESAWGTPFHIQEFRNAAVPVGINTLAIGSNLNGSVSLIGRIKNITYYPSRLRSNVLKQLLK